MSELNKCRKKLHNMRTYGTDKIIAIINKSPLFHAHLLEFCNKAKWGNKSKVLSISSILPHPKKSDLSILFNYRGITPSAIASKMYNSMLLNRLVEHVDPLLRRNQHKLFVITTRILDG